MMDTKRWNLRNDAAYNRRALEEAGKMLIDGSAVAFPTETVYGLGADATNSEAVKKIFDAKGRPQDNPLIAHVASKKQLLRLVDNLPSYVENLIDFFTPGPLTFVLPSNGTCAKNVTAGLPTIGIRIPDHPIAQSLLKYCDIPIAAPSANISGKPSPTTGDHVWADLNGKISGLLDAGPTGVGLESTVIDCTQDIPVILRPGGITMEQLQEVIGTAMIDPAIINKGEKPKSPGMKYRHYSPEVPLWLIEGSADKIQSYIDKKQDEGHKVGVLAAIDTSALLSAEEIIPLGGNMNEIAANLYNALRTFRQGDVDIILCEAFPEEGIGQAVMNRLRKAATEIK